MDAAAYVVQVIDSVDDADPGMYGSAEDLGWNVLYRFYGVEYLQESLALEFFVGFIQGATEIWEGVKDDI